MEKINLCLATSDSYFLIVELVYIGLIEIEQLHLAGAEADQYQRQARTGRHIVARRHSQLVHSSVD